MGAHLDIDLESSPDLSVLMVFWGLAGGAYPSTHWGRHPARAHHPSHTPRRGQTDTCKNITLAISSLRPVNMFCMGEMNEITNRSIFNGYTDMLTESRSRLTFIFSAVSSLSVTNFEAPKSCKLLCS